MTRHWVNFNPRSHERSDVPGVPRTLASYHFNPRSHERSDDRPSWSDRHMLYISIHAPTRGATAVFFVHCPMPLFQSTLPREERQYGILKSLLTTTISIHAPTRGATEIQFAVPCDYEFQSTLPREERPYFHFHCSISLIFQSTLPREERLTSSDAINIVTNISIHAPTRGATALTSCLKTTQKQFQSTLPREERQLYVQGLLRLYDISIHAPTRGATEIHLFYSKPTNRISIHAPTRGATGRRYLHGHHVH